jgi:hypothetical protein
MKTKLQLLFALLLAVTSLQAQNTDVWDFGAVPVAGANNNLLSAAIINGWYPGTVAAGTSGVNFPVSFTVGALSWVGNSGDRLRTTNTALSRFDNNIASVVAYTGRVYCNGAPSVSGGVPTNRFMRMALNEDDEVTIVTRGDAASNLNFVYEANPALQTNVIALPFATAEVTSAKFVAKNAGNFKIYSIDGKPSFYRILRKAAVYTAVSGSIDLSLAPGIPSNYAVVFTNAAGKSWTSTMNLDGTYNANLPIGYSYTITLVNANGYIITNGTTLDLTTVVTPTFLRNISILQATLYQVTGSITGLGTSISSLALSYVADPASNTVYVPTPVINTAASTYTVQLQANVPYTIVAQGVNDYQITTNTITIPTSNTTANIAFTAKPVFPVSISTIGLTPTQLSNLHLTFTNLNESGYVYNFNDISTVSLRNGTYSVAATGLDNYPVQLALTSNVTVNGSGVSKTLAFVPVTVWSFDDKVISTTTTASYKGMLLTGQITTVVASGHLTAKTGATLQVPVHPGEKISVSYYFTGNFSIEGGATITTATNSTSILENVEYTYTGVTDGYVTITIGGAAALTTYFTEIKIGGSIPYQPIITVGSDKQYQTINAALTAVSNMTRTSTERVTIAIDPGNYEEMLSINQANVTLKNAATTPNTNLINAGVDITPGAVRVTSYYGHGYNYYSMSSDQKWHQDVLNVNIQNGSASYQNVGAGTTNNSYWNATVVVGADGFEAEGIIFENSFNQYISLKESQDVVQMSAGAPGARPTNYGNTSVQNRPLVERAAAIAIKNNIQKVLLNKCRVVGRQDSFFGGTGARVAVYKGDYMGAVDYIFGGMDVVFYRSNLSMNTSDASNDAAYITAAQQSTGRGYLMYECTVTTAQPLVETASIYRAKPGYFGRPWQANTSEVVFFNTTIETSNFPGSVGNSLILPLGWQNTLGGTSSGMYEYGTTEQSGVNNTPFRASWSTSLTNPVLNDSTPITTFNFTKGNDNWDPFPLLIANDQPVTCFTSGTQTASSAPTCFGLSDGSSTITMSPLPTSLSATYVLDGGAATPVTLSASGQFTITGLAAGSHTLVVTGNGTCTTVVTVTDVSIAAGTQPAQPTLACYETAIFNSTTCSWDVTGTQPTQPTLLCNQTATFNTITCVWDITTGPNTINTTTITACDSYTWADTGLIYTVSGTYTGTTTNCVTEQLVLTINNSTTGTTNATACNTYTWAAPLGNGTTYTASTTASNISANAAGCPHTETLNLTINSSTTGTTTATACDTYTWSDSLGNGQTYTASTIVTNVTTNAAGCPHTETLNLTINSSTTGTITATACDTYTWSAPLGNGQTYTSSVSGVTFVSTNAAGCAHTQTLNLTINNSTLHTTTATACNTYTWALPLGTGLTYTASQSGITNVTTNAAGCTHTEKLNLTINNSTINGNATVSAASVYTWPLPLGTGLAYTTSGIYTSTTTNAAGCPNVATLNLTIGVPTVNTFNIGTSCGATISGLSVTIIAGAVPGATSYTFRLTNLTTSAVQTIVRPVNSFALSNYPGITFGTAYQIEVSVNNGPFGTPCIANTPSPVSNIGAQCGTTLTSMNEYVYATYYANVTGYRYRITNPSNNTVQIYDSPLYRFYFNQLPNRSFGTTYLVEVALRNTDGTYLPYSAGCNITTQAFPTTSLQASQCGYTAASNKESIYATLVSGATDYRYLLSRTSAPTYSSFIERPLSSFSLSMFTGLTAGTTYSVQVAVKIGGIWGPYGSACNVTTPGAVRTTSIANAPFKAIAYPNPFAEDFMLDVKTTADSTIQIRVYDMLGKQVENRNVEVADLEGLQVGANYPSGVYNVIVSQGENTQTLRVIKR